MEIKITDSENIKSMFYFETTKELWVYFNSVSLYIYKDIDKELANNLNNAEDKGKYFYSHIRSEKEFDKKY